MVGSGDAGEAVMDEFAKLALHVGSALTVGAVSEVGVDVAFAWLCNGAVEEEVDDAFHIVTNHDGDDPSVELPWCEIDSVAFN